MPIPSSATPADSLQLCPVLPPLLALPVAQQPAQDLAPDVFLGMTSTNSIPPLSHLCRLFSFSTCLAISRMTILSDSSSPTEVDLTTNALGTSPAASSGTAMTAQSAT